MSANAEENLLHIGQQVLAWLLETQPRAQVEEDEPVISCCLLSRIVRDAFDVDVKHATHNVRLTALVLA